MDENPLFYQNFNLRTNLEQIFRKNKLGPIKKFSRIKKGFRNILFDVNSQYIVKICGNISQVTEFRNEIALNEYYLNKIPVPQVVFKDFSKKIIPTIYYISKKIQGKSLFTVWNSLTKLEKEDLIQQFAKILKVINYSDITSIIEKPLIPWKSSILQNILDSLDVIQKKKLLKENIIDNLQTFINNYDYALEFEENEYLRPVYWDAHFDNILVQNKQISGIIDLESIQYMSLDYVLDIIIRMSNYPKLYVSEGYEHLINKSDFNYVPFIFKKYYPELFKSPNLRKRIQFYAIRYDLNIFLKYPHEKLLVKRIEDTLLDEYPSIDFFL